MQGVVKFFDSKKGYGFISVSGNHRDVFVHKTGLRDVKVLQEGDKVSFELTKGPKGEVACNCKLLS
jgi:CspA family cold shock protein